MKIIIFGFISVLLIGFFFVSQASAEIGESVAIDKTAYKEDVAQIKAL